MTCFAVVWTTWTYDDICSVLSCLISQKRWFQFNSRIVRTHFASVMALNNCEIIEETRSYIFRWRPRCRRCRIQELPPSFKIAFVLSNFLSKRNESVSLSAVFFLHVCLFCFCFFHFFLFSKSIWLTEKQNTDCHFIDSSTSDHKIIRG